MSFNHIRGAKTSKEIMRIKDVEVSKTYCDKRAKGISRHKIYATIRSGNVREVIQSIQAIIKKNYPDSFPQLYKGCYDNPFVQIVWFSEKEPHVDKIFKVLLEDEGYSIGAVAG